jgi:hypothetical protein
MSSFGEVLGREIIRLGQNEMRGDSRRGCSWEVWSGNKKSNSFKVKSQMSRGKAQFYDEGYEEVRGMVSGGLVETVA